MLSISVMGGGQGQYYAGLAREDYYLEGGEPPGEWLGRGAEALGLSGMVDNKEFQNLFHGWSSDGKEALVQNAGMEKRKAGWDLTFSAPKSVSVFWSQTTPEVQRHIQRSHFTAVKKSLNYLEEVAGITRRKKGGHCYERAGFVVATFEHGTSRAMDAQLHTHALLLNVATRDDGSTGALETSLLYRHKMAAGALYRAELAYLLARDLGLELKRKKSWFEVEGVPESLIDEFSKRRDEIERELERSGFSGARASEFATLATRQTKIGHLPRNQLFQEWRQIGQTHGFSQEATLQLLGKQPLPDRAVARKEVLLHLGTAIVESNSTFTIRDVVKFAAQESQTKGLGADDALGIAKEFLQSEQSIHIGRYHDDIRYTTIAQVWAENGLISKLEASQTRNIHKVENPIVDAVLGKDAYQHLTDEQVKGVRQITQKAGSIQAISGIAGAGKTSMLKAACEIWEQAGLSTIGVAVSGQAANNLWRETEIQSYTIARFLANQDLVKRIGSSPEIEIQKGALHSQTVLVVDEAGMVGTRQMVCLVEACERAKAKLVLVGDEKQLQPIETGGAFQEVQQRVGVARLTKIMRQEEAWARKAVFDLATGQAEAALKAYAEHGQLSIGSDRREAMGSLFQAWKQDGVKNPKEHLILVGTNSDRAILNRMAQNERLAEDQLGRARLQIHEAFCYEGDRIVFRKNSPVYNVMNGNRGTVLSVDTYRETLSVQLDSGEVKVISFSQDKNRGYDRDDIHLGYAVTTYQAQGATVSYAYVLTDESRQNRELSYVQASRAKRAVRFFTSEIEAGEELTELVKKMNRSQPKELAVKVIQQVEQQTHQYL